MKTKYYPLGDHLNLRECEAFNLPKVGGTFNTRDIRAKLSGEFRNPRKGEWYLSGAIPHAYRTPNDLSSKFHIAKIVLTQTVVTTTITEV